MAAQEAKASLTRAPGRLARAATATLAPTGSLSTRFAAATSSVSSGRKLLDSRSLEEGKLRQLLTFDGCPELLRGCRLSTIMRRGAAIFESSQGDASTYALSEQTTRLQVFCSHNWVVNRWSKFCCLAFHYNKRLALAAAVAVLAVISVPSYMGLLPTYTFNGLERTFLARILTTPITLFVGMFGRDIFPCFKGPVVFLDKVCIHQEDPDLQRRAILKLGAFLRNSDKMLILFTDVYFTKLWTIFELASYLSLNPVEKISLIHCSVPVAWALGWLLFYLNDMVVLVANIMVDEYYVEVPMTVLVSIAFATHLRALARSELAMHTQLANFSVRDCTCAQEGDREVVYQNIVEMVQQLHEQSLSRRAALRRFDDLVKEEIPKAVRKSLGRLGIRYHHIACFGGVLMFPRAADCLVGLRHGLHWRVYFTKIFLFYIAWAAVVSPMVVLSIFRVASAQLHRRGAAQWLICIAAGFTGVLVAQIALQLADALEAAVRRSTWAAVAYGLGIAAAAAALRSSMHFGLEGCCGRGSGRGEVEVQASCSDQEPPPACVGCTSQPAGEEFLQDLERTVV